MIPPLPDLILEPLVRAALFEDLGSHGDITTRTVIPVGTRTRGAIRAREGGTASGMGLAALAFRLIDPALRLEVMIPDGTPCFAAGHPREILAERGLKPVAVELIDPAAMVTTTVWER